MASMKAEKPVGSSLFGQAKKEQPASTGATAPKAPASKSSSKPAPKKAATPKTQEPKKKPAARGGKSAASKQ